MMDEKSVDHCSTLDAARTRGQEVLEQEIIPCVVWIANADGDHVEDVESPDGRTLADRMSAFNAAFKAKP